MNVSAPVVTVTKHLPNSTQLDYRLSVAPMLDWTDRHCRYFHRLLTPHARLYTEMITSGALLFGNAERHLEYHAAEHPVVLQLGGSDPHDLAACAKMAQQWGYDEVNLNCGCPSDRVQKGAFGACLMKEPQKVAGCVKAMQDACDLPITIKHRIGLDQQTDTVGVYNFVETLYNVGVRYFIVHARNAVLKGLSPKQNREIPPLRYEVAQFLVQSFPDAQFILNGGINTWEIVEQSLFLQQNPVAGVMIGRQAYHEPRFLRSLSCQLWSDTKHLSDDQVIQGMIAYIQQNPNVPLHLILKPLLGFANGMKGARKWRQQLSGSNVQQSDGAAVLEKAWNSLVQQV